MSDFIQREHQLKGAEGRPFTLDYTLLDDGKTDKPLIVFCHGFKGFKDWGHWGETGKAFAREGFAFVKFNFSHNGTTPETPLDFSDLDAFGRNTYSKELYDLQVVLDWLYEGKGLPSGLIDSKRICLSGHSRGGGIAILQAARDKRIGALATWASVARLDYSWQHPELIEKWEREGVIHAYNGRTKQQMPLYFELYRDFQAHKEEYDCCRAAASLQIPMLIVHGTEDPAVSVQAAKELKACQPAAEPVFIEGADHVFGGRHPWTEGERLPAPTLELIRRQTDFLRKHRLA